jgi:hypothetical protein
MGKNNLTKIVAGGLIIGSVLWLTCNKIKDSNLVQNWVEKEYIRLNEKNIEKIGSYIKGIKFVNIQKGIGYLDLIEKDLQTNDRLRRLKKELGWNRSELVDVYKRVNRGELDYGRENRIPEW